MTESHPEDLDQDEDRIVEMVKEWLWENEQIKTYIKARIEMYWADPYRIDLDGPMSDFQEEFVCQCQVQLMNMLLAKVMVA